MNAGNIARDKGNLMITSAEKDSILKEFPDAHRLVRRLAGSDEAINGLVRYCLWIKDEDADYAAEIPLISERLEKIREYRANGSERGKLVD
jgi:hypothetical protein